MSLKNITLTIFLFLLALSGVTEIKAATPELAIIGNIPHRYLKGTSGKKYQLGLVYIKNRVIQKILPITSNKQLGSIKKKIPKAKIIYANKSGTANIKENFDFIYPGLIDLHNHTKQNNLGVWSEARGQFKNRFEWRGWNVYKYSVSGNMNPWVGFGKPVECATFRWSELQAMVLGVTYLQGPSSCIKNYSIHQVEDTKSYISNKAKIQAPTDLVIPADMTYVWQVLRPLIVSGKTYEQALAQKINETCDLPGISAKTVNTRAALKILKDKKLLVKSCTKKKLHKKFLRYVYWIHPTIAGRKNYLKNPKRAAVIAHLAEGRRDDFYNQREFEIVKLLGLAQPKVNFVHGVGIKPKDFKLLAKKDMGLIWSIYSNLLLYGETLDIYKAKKAGINLALGSDWLPTGSRGVLEELKIAAAYVQKDPYRQGLKKVFTDEQLFLMVTENPAKMINHFEINVSKKEHGIGQIREGAMGTLITATKLLEDPYSNIVRKVWAKDLNLVVIDGKPIYGNQSYLSQVGIPKNKYESLPMYFEDINKLSNTSRVKTHPEEGATKESKYNHLVQLGKMAKSLKVRAKDNCGFDEKKGFVHQNSVANEPRLKKFFQETKLNLDRFEDIYKLLSINILTQSRNRNEPSKGKAKFAIKEVAPLYSCHDDSYLRRLTEFIIPKSSNDEFEHNRERSFVENLRKKQKLGNVPAKLAKEYE